MKRLRYFQILLAVLFSMLPKLSHADTYQFTYVGLGYTNSNHNIPETASFQLSSSPTPSAVIGLNFRLSNVSILLNGQVKLSDVTFNGLTPYGTGGFDTTPTPMVRAKSSSETYSSQAQPARPSSGPGPSTCPASASRWTTPKAASSQSPTSPPRPPPRNHPR